MVRNTNEIGGKAMAVIVGTICLIGPWFSEISFGAKFLVSLIGIVLIFLGTRN